LGGRRGLAIIISVLILVCIVVSVDIAVSTLCSRAKSGEENGVYRGLAIVIQEVYYEQPRDAFREYILLLNSSLNEYNGFSIMDVEVYRDDAGFFFYIVFRDGERLIVFTRPVSSPYIGDP